jgi:hypothetical protein
MVTLQLADLIATLHLDLHTEIAVGDAPRLLDHLFERAHNQQSDDASPANQSAALCRGCGRSHELACN